MRRDLVAGLARVSALLATIFFLDVCPAFAGTSIGSGDGSVSDGSITATATSSSPGDLGSTSPGVYSSASGGSGGSPPPPPCYYVPASASVSASLGAGGSGPGTWYTWYCTSPLGYINNPKLPVWVAAGSTPTATPSVPALLQQAIDHAPLVSPTINVDPPGQQVVFIPTWLWISPDQWSVVVATATAGNVATTVMATPTTVAWTFGNGVSLACPGPGVPYAPAEPAGGQSTYCQYAWPASSADQPGAVYQLTATIEYEVTTTVAGAPDPTPDLGMYAGPTATAEIPVSEIEALGTNP